MSISLLPTCQCCSINTTGGNFCPFSMNSGHSCVFICSTVTTNKIKDLWEEFSIGFVFAFYLSSPKWITTAQSWVWRALRDSQAGTIEVKAWEQCHKHDLKFCRCFFSHRLALAFLLSIALSLPISLSFSFFSHRQSLSVCLFAIIAHILAFFPISFSSALSVLV